MVKGTISVAVIITTYRRSDLIVRAISSVLEQTGDFELEVIVVDDNGEESGYAAQTKERVESISDARLTYLALEENRGACEARNIGVAYSKSEFIFFLDDDDLFLPGKIAQQINFLQQHAELDGCLAGFVRLAGDGTEIKSENNFPRLGDFKEFAFHGNFFTPMLCIRKNSFERVGGFKSIPRFQDRYFMLHALAAGLRFGALRAKLHVMHEHEGQRITSNGIRNTQQALQTIKTFIATHLSLSEDELKAYQLRDTLMLATAHYVSSAFSSRIKAARLYLKAFSISRDKQYLLRAAKSLLK